MIQLNALYHVCPLLPHLVKDKEKFSDNSIYSGIQYLAPPIRELMSSCDWQNHKCDEWWFPVFTDDGLCYTFNALNWHEIYTNEWVFTVILSTL